MNKELIDKLLKLGSEAGFTAQEVYYYTGERTVIQVYKGEISDFEMNLSSGYSYRVIYNEKIGFTYTEILTEEMLPELVNKAKENASVIENEDKVFMYEGAKEYKKIEYYSDELKEIPIEEKIKLVKDIEKYGYEYSDKIENMNHVTYSETSSNSYIINTLGLSAQKRSSYAMAYAGAVAKDGEESRNSAFGDFNKDFRQLDARKIGETAAKNAIAKIGSTVPKSGPYDIVFPVNTGSEIFSVFLGSLSADAVQKNLSYFTGKLGTTVAGENIDITDDPFVEGSPYSYAMDAEGVPAKVTKLVEKGKLVSFLHNLKTAYKDGIETTANGSRAGYQSAVGIGTSNLMISNGKTPYDELMNRSGGAIYVDSLSGLHSGANTLTGDFSFQAEGFLIEDGKLSKPLSQFTVSGNFYELLFNITDMANDRRSDVLGSPDIQLPTLKVKGLTVSGS